MKTCPPSLNLAPNSCQLDTHLNDATPRRNDKSHGGEHQEQWQLPPTLQYHPSHNKSHHKSDAKDCPAQQKPDVPGAVESEIDDEAKGEPHVVCARCGEAH